MNPGTNRHNAEDFTMTTATVTARDLFSFLDTHGRYTVADGTRYDEVTDGHGNSFFVPMDVQVRGQRDRSSP